jgi:ketosteroid isomerase-like protein
VRRGLLGALLAAGLACAGRERPRSDPSILTVADRALARAVAERGLDAWVGAFAEDGVIVTADGVVGPGFPVIRAHMAPVFADPAFRLVWRPVFARISASDDVGYTVGEFQSRRSDATRGIVEMAGSYVTVWGKDRDGAWQVVLTSMFDAQR